MKKGEISEGIIEKIDFPDKGILYTPQGEKVMIKNTVPGQNVRFLLQKKRKGKYEGRLLEILEKSPLELDTAPCIHFGSCGGCAYQNLRYEEQLRLKEQQVMELLSPIVKAPASEWFAGVRPAPQQFAYRNKMEFSFGDEYKDGPLALGMHKRGSFYDLVTVDQCRIVDADYNRILRATLDYFTERKTGYLKKNSHEGYLRHLLVRKAAKTGEILIDLITTTQPCNAFSEETLLAGFRDMLLGLPLSGRIVGILHTRNDSLADVIKDEGTDILFGQDYFYEELSGLTFKISPFSFFQTNSSGAELLYATARELIGSFGKSGSVVYDLYSGTGTIAQMLAPAAGKVIGVEIIEEAVAAARENAERNGLTNCTFLAGDVLTVLDTVKEKPDFIVLDPPREGVHPKALKKIIDYGVERMVYISCKPTSLARDLEVLLGCGYRVERCCCIDQFPGTMHVETVCLLSKLNVEQHIEVELNLDEIDGSGE